MRMLHTADWHLGRIFHGLHLTEDQAFTLDGLVEIATETQPDVILISGDLYDRAVPPPDAVALLDDVLSRLVLQTACAVIAISGNHDSPERVSFGGRLLSHARVHLHGRPSFPLQSVTLLDEHGPVHFWPLPFSEPRVIRSVFAEAPLLARTENAARIEGHGAALTHLVARASSQLEPGARHVALAHGSVAGFKGTESERPLWMGPDGAADAAIFKPFNYAALGHHHRPQDVGGDLRVRYPGSLQAYSFSENEHTPSVTLIDLDGQGQVQREVIELPIRHPVRTLRGTFADLMKEPTSSAFLKIVLTDTQPVLDPLPRLRERFENALVLEQERLLQISKDLPRAANTRLDDVDLFASFFREMTGSDPSEAEDTAYRAILERVFSKEREAE